MGEERTFEGAERAEELDPEETSMSGTMAVVLVTTILAVAFLLNLQINTTVTTNEALKDFQSACTLQGGQYTLSEALPSTPSENPVDRLLGERVRLVHTCRIAGEVAATLLG